MTWNEMEIKVLNPGVWDLNAAEFDASDKTEAFGRWLRPEIKFKAADSNAAPIYLAENSGDSADKQFPLFPWKTLTLDYSTYVKTMNIFYVTWGAGDILSVICR